MGAGPFIHPYAQDVGGTSPFTEDAAKAAIKKYLDLINHRPVKASGDTEEVGVRFDFGNEKDSIYSVDLHIEEKCTGFLFDDKTLSWQGVSSGDKIIQEMIDE